MADRNAFFVCDSLKEEEKVSSSSQVILIGI